MRHHRHIPKCHQPAAAARRCQAHRSDGAERRQRVRPRSSRACRIRGTSRIGPALIREPRGHETAGRSADPASWKDPDCRGGVLVSLLRLIGGRR